MNRIIGHLDLDYFYAQVEEVQNPSIKNRPVIVCVFSGRTEDSGVVSTSNYRARELGVHSGMPIVLAKKKLSGSDPAVIPMDHQKYETISERIIQTVSEMVDALEQAGIDEFFFDLTDSSSGDFESARRTAQLIKQTILRKESLTCSIGIGRSKGVAKIGSETTKPDGLTVILPEDTLTFLEPLSVSKMYGVGPKTTVILEKMNVRTVGELSKTDPGELERNFGRKLAAYLLAASTGMDEGKVTGGLEPTQFSRIVTLKRDTKDPSEALAQLTRSVESLKEKLAQTGKSFRTVTAIAILTDLSTHTKSKTLETPVKDSALMLDSAEELFRELSGSVQKNFRRVGLRLSGLTDEQDQKSLSEFVQSAGE